ncbi:MAG: hypothetical protein AAF585_19830 [Verrucomicrobiota bacterium]
MKWLRILIWTLLVFGNSAAAGPVVQIVVAEDAHPLEKAAAEQIRADFHRLFEAEAKLVDAADSNFENAIRVGVLEDLEPQEHLVRSGKGKLIVGGGSPAATLWAACELGQHFGMRYTLQADFTPIEKPEFSLEDIDIQLKPNVEIRGWRSIGPFGPGSQESWGIAEHQQLLGQLAKLKFNHVTLVLGGGRPFLHSVEADQLEGKLWLGHEFEVGDDAAGGSVFGDAEVFENSDFVRKEEYVDRLQAGIELANGIVAKARELGMSVSIDIEPKLLGAAKKTYPNVDDFETSLVTLNLGHSHAGVLPQMTTSNLPDLLTAIRDGAEGFEVRAAIPGDVNAGVYFLSRASFNAEITPSETLTDLVTPVCDKDAADRLAMAFEAIEKANKLIRKHDKDFALPAPDMFMKHYESSEPAPAWWAEAKALYGEAAKHPELGAHPFTDYHAKRFTFAHHYLSAVEFVRAAGIAKADGDLDTQIKNVRLAADAIRDALNAYSEVVRDNSDRGVIALLNAYAYRPLIEILDTAP